MREKITLEEFTEMSVREFRELKKTLTPYEKQIIKSLRENAKYYSMGKMQGKVSANIEYDGNGSVIETNKFNEEFPDVGVEKLSDTEFKFSNIQQAVEAKIVSTEIVSNKQSILPDAGEESIGRDPDVNDGGLFSFVANTPNELKLSLIQAEHNMCWVGDSENYRFGSSYIGIDLNFDATVDGKFTEESVRAILDSYSRIQDRPNIVYEILKANPIRTQDEAIMIMRMSLSEEEGSSYYYGRNDELRNFDDIPFEDLDYNIKTSPVTVIADNINNIYFKSYNGKLYVFYNGDDKETDLTKFFDWDNEYIRTHVVVQLKPELTDEVKDFVDTVGSFIPYRYGSTDTDEPLRRARKKESGMFSSQTGEFIMFDDPDEVETYFMDAIFDKVIETGTKEIGNGFLRTILPTVMNLLLDEDSDKESAYSYLKMFTTVVDKCFGDDVQDIECFTAVEFKDNTIYVDVSELNMITPNMSLEFLIYYGYIGLPATHGIKSVSYSLCSDMSLTKEEIIELKLDKRRINRNVKIDAGVYIKSMYSYKHSHKHIFFSMKDYNSFDLFRNSIAEYGELDIDMINRCPYVATGNRYATVATRDIVDDIFKFNSIEVIKTTKKILDNHGKFEMHSNILKKFVANDDELILNNVDKYQISSVSNLKETLAIAIDKNISSNVGRDPLSIYKKNTGESLATEDPLFFGEDMSTIDTNTDIFDLLVDGKIEMNYFQSEPLKLVSCNAKLENIKGINEPNNIILATTKELLFYIGKDALYEKDGFYLIENKYYTEDQLKKYGLWYGYLERNNIFVDKIELADNGDSYKYDSKDIYIKQISILDIDVKNDLNIDDTDIKKMFIKGIGYKSVDVTDIESDKISISRLSIFKGGVDLTKIKTKTILTDKEYIKKFIYSIIKSSIESAKVVEFVIADESFILESISMSELLFKKYDSLSDELKDFFIETIITFHKEDRLDNHWVQYNGYSYNHYHEYILRTRTKPVVYSDYVKNPFKRIDSYVLIKSFQDKANVDIIDDCNLYFNAEDLVAFLPSTHFNNNYSSVERNVIMGSHGWYRYYQQDTKVLRYSKVANDFFNGELDSIADYYMSLSETVSVDKITGICYCQGNDKSDDAVYSYKYLASDTKKAISSAGGCDLKSKEVESISYEWYKKSDSDYKSRANTVDFKISKDDDGVITVEYVINSEEEYKTRTVNGVTTAYYKEEEEE